MAVADQLVNEAHLVHDMLVTVAAALAGGAFLITLARRVKTSAIGLLIIGAYLLGPEMAGILKPDSLGLGLRVIVSMAIGIILFEGGLTLDLKGYRDASTVIKKLLSFGVMITWFGTALAVWALFQFPLAYCMLFGSLVIVTGPTVIAPLLRRIRLESKLHNVLHWEGVLIDPIGVFAALLCYEYVVGLESGDSGLTSLITLLQRVGVGGIVGILCGFILVEILKRRIVPQEMTNVFTLGFAILTFGIADYYFAEAGLLSVTVAGFIVGWKKPIDFESIKTFKAELTDILIGLLFMLLASRLELAQFLEFGWKGYLLVGIVMLAIRPLSLAVCSYGSDLNIRQKLFLGWVAPRGIVAASFASIVALNLSNSSGGVAASMGLDPKFPETFVYSVIIGTMVFQEFTAGFYAKFLKLQQPEPNGWLIVGAHNLSRHVAKFLKKNGVEHIYLVDSNKRACDEARRDNLHAMVVDARDPKIQDDIPELRSVGHIIALTDNENLNVLICDRWSKVVKEGRSYFWGSSNMAEGKHARLGKALWGDLPKPTILSEELARREARMVTTEEPFIKSDGRSSRLLAAFSHKSIMMDPTPEDVDPKSEGVAYLYLRRQADSVLRAISPHLVVLDDFEDLDSLFRKLVQMASKVNPEPLPADELVKALHDREKSAPTAVGHGIAIPHCTSDMVDHRICVIAKCPNGVPFETLDNEPVQMVFLILSPNGDPEGHLAILAEIARLVSNSKLRDALREADDAEGLLAILHQQYLPRAF